MNLQTVSEALAAHLAAGHPVPPSAKAGVSDYQLLAMVKRMWSWGFAILFVGILLSVLGRRILHNELIFGIGALVGIMSLLPLGYPVLYAISASWQAKERALRQSAPALGLAPPETNPLPERGPGPVPSVTDRTTDLLAAADPASERQAL
jgi:hypothetical protein